MIYIICGEGKGKTTSLIGQVIRALGNKKKVLFIQFLKGKNTGEYKFFNFIRKLDMYKSYIKYRVFGNGAFIRNEEDKKKARNMVKKGIEFLEKELSRNKYFLVALDEINYAFYLNVIDEPSKRKLIEIFKKYQDVNFFLTGRNPPKEIKKLAVMISEIKNRRHHLEIGIKARKGIEF